MPHKKPTPLSDEDAAVLERLRQQERAAPKTEPAANRTARWRDKTKDPIGSDGKGGIRIEHPRPGGR